MNQCIFCMPKAKLHANFQWHWKFNQEFNTIVMPGKPKVQQTVKLHLNHKHFLTFDMPESVLQLSLTTCPDINKKQRHVKTTQIY